MIFQCSDLERALRSPELMPDAREHAETCARCREELFLWQEISRVAPQLREEWDSPALWPRIRAGLEAAGPARKPVPVWRWAIAAVAVLGMAAALSFPWGGSAPPSRTFLTDEALHDVQQAEAAYAHSIEKLSKVAAPSLDQSPSPLAAAYRDKLTVMDSAIADLKTNVAGNRYNIYLQSQLASLYKEKQKTLQEWLENAKRN